MKPNNVSRLLDAQHIPYTAFDLPVEKLGAIEVAAHLGVPPEFVFKTIVVLREGKGKSILAVVPGSKEVNLKALARSVGEKKVHLATEREAEKLTGLQVGGISPLALIHKGFQVVLDESAQEMAQIYISGGQRGLDIRLPVSALIHLVNASLAPISS